MINEKPVICPSTNAKTSIIERLDHIGYKKIIWALAVCETIHNIEEAVWLTDTLQFAEKWNVTTGAFEIRFAIIVLTLLIYGIVYYFSVSEGTVANFLIGGVLVAILFNVLVPHITGSVLTLNYMPGLITGLLLNVPTTFYLLRRGIKEHRYNLKSLIKSGAILILLTIPVLQTLFFLGRMIPSFV